MAKPTTATPIVSTDGFHDISSRALPTPTVETPQHLALVRVFAEDGPEYAIFNGDNTVANRIYGSKTFDTRSPYFNLQTLLARTLMKAGNSVLIKRMIPADAAPPARLTIGIDWVKDKVVDPDNAASKASDPASPRIDGIRARLVVIPDNKSAIGTQQVVAGNIVAADGTQSKVFPLVEFDTGFVGKKGNLKGIRLWAPTAAEDPAYDAQASKDFKARMYRIQLVQREKETASPSVFPTKLGDGYADFTFQEGVYNASTGVEYGVEDNLLDQFRDDGHSTNQAPKFAPFGKVFVYHENLATVQQLVREIVLGHDPALASELTGPGMVDVLGGKSLQGKGYKGFSLEGQLSGGVQFGQDKTVYAVGGSDGTLSQKNYEDLVVAHNNNLDQGNEDLTNPELYPFSVVYDTGLSMEGKYSLASILAARRDVRIVLSTFVEGETRKLTKNEELSRARTLHERIAVIPESVLYGTGICRATVIVTSGKHDSDYRKTVPLLFDYASKWAAFGGAGDGKLKKQFQPDVAPNNVVKTVRDLNITSFRDEMKTQLWGAGGVWAQPSDVRTFYYPAFHSVYADDTSVLSSDITVAIATDVSRQVRKAHAAFSGNASLTDEQFVERCNDYIKDQLVDRYAGRVALDVEVFLSDFDKLAGYSWSARVTIYANNMKTFFSYEIALQRRGELANNPAAAARAFTA